MAGSERYEFGPFVLEADQHRLRAGHAEVALPPKALDTLLLLVRRAGQLVGREEFFAVLWPDTVVTDASLGRCIWQVRRALGQGEADGTYIQTVPKKGYRFVAPVRRLADPTAAMAVETDTPAAGAVPGGGSHRAPVPARWSRFAWPASIVLALLVATVLASLPPPPSAVPQAAIAPVPAPAPTRTRASIALFDLGGMPPSQSWLPAAVTDLLGYELSLDESLQVVRGDPLARLVPLEAGRSPDRTSLDHLNHQLGIPLAIVGNCVDDGAKLRVEVQLLDTATGRTLQTIAVDGDPRRPSGVVVAAGDRLRDFLDLARPSSALEGTRQATTPGSASGLRDYTEGILAMRRGNSDVARQRLQAAIIQDPNFLPARLALTRVLIGLGRDREATGVARAGLARASRAPREMRLALEARLHEADKRWPDTISAYEELHRLYPEDVDYGLDYGRALARGGRSDQALAVLDGMRQRAANPRIDFMASAIAQQTGDGPRALRSAQAALRGARELQAPLLVAEALARRGVAHRLLGNPRDALADYEQARELFRRHADPLSEAGVAVSLGVYFAERGEFARAKQLLQQATDIFNRLDYRSGTAAVQLNLASIALHQNDNLRARRHMETALQLGRELGETQVQAAALSALAILQQDAGETTAALGTYAEALEVARQGGMPGRQSNILDGFAELQRLRGAYALADQLSRQALSLARDTRNPKAEAEALQRLGAIQFDMGRRAAARTSLSQALALYERHQLANDAANVKLGLVAIALAEHDPETARSLLATAIPVLHAAQVEDDVAMGRALEAETLTALGRPEAARKSLARALGYANRNADSARYVPILMSEARVLAAQGNPQAASERLHVALRKVQDRGLDGVARQIRQLEAGLQNAPAPLVRR